LKKCCKCGIEKDESEFYYSKHAANHCNSYCKLCTKEYSREYRKHHYVRKKENIKPFDQNILSKRYREKDPLRYILRSVISRAKRKGIPYDSFEILYNHLKEGYSKKICACCGKELVLLNTGYGGNMDSASIDRLIPDLGYIVGNLNILCRQCNFIKTNATYEQIYQVAKWLENEMRNRT
jgi:hypothetical protein